MFLSNRFNGEWSVRGGNRMDVQDINHKFENTWLILDQSASQSFQHFSSDGVDVENFFVIKGIEKICTKDSSKELIFQEKPNLFSTASIEPNRDTDEPNRDYFKKDLSLTVSSNGVLVDSTYHPDEKNIVEVQSVIEENYDDRTPLFKSHPSYQRMKKKAFNKENFSDLSNIELFSELRGEGRDAVVFVGDKDQKKYLREIERAKILDPLGLLLWMEKSDFIKPQKSVCIFKNWGKSNKSISWQNNYQSLKEGRKKYEWKI